jgi:hypothetical protein
MPAGLRKIAGDDPTDAAESNDRDIV